MKIQLTGCALRSLLLTCFSAAVLQLSAQTDMDGIMMNKNALCTGFDYSYNSWSHYWEGKLNRTNENMGTVSTQMIGWMGTYGITDKINIVAGLPYVKTKATQGTQHGVDGLQDASLSVKWEAWQKKVGPGNLKLFAVGTYSFPVSNYVADYLPLAIGLRSKNITLRVIADYQVGSFFATGTAAYVHRSNITIDRSAYYTTEMHLTNKVEMPDAVNFQLRVGYRSVHLNAEVIVSNMTTLGGFDITRNNFPFPSNRMNATMAGANFKYVPTKGGALSIVGGVNYTVAGRNVGQAITVNSGVFYAFNFSHKKTSSQPAKTK